jgi:hypothetical protein
LRSRERLNRALGRYGMRPLPPANATVEEALAADYEAIATDYAAVAGDWARTGGDPAVFDALAPPARRPAAR